MCVRVRREGLGGGRCPDAGPEVAVRRLRTAIRRCPELLAELTAEGRCFDRRRLLTQREVRLIRRYLC